MKLIPSVKNQIKGDKIEIKGCTFKFEKGCDERLVKASKKVPQGETVVNVIVNGENGQDYTIVPEIKITTIPQMVIGKAQTAALKERVR